MITNLDSINFPLLPESQQNQDGVRNKIHPSTQVNTLAIDCLTQSQISKKSPSHPNSLMEKNNVPSTNEIENLFKCLKCIDAEFVKSELTKAFLLIKQQDYITAQIIILEIALMHESPGVKCLIDNLLALIPAEDKKRKYSEISSSDGLNSEESSSVDTDSDSSSECGSDSDLGKYGTHKGGRDYDFFPSKKMKVDQTQSLPSKNLRTSIRQYNVITPEIIANAQRMLNSGSKVCDVARDLHVNYHTLYGAISNGKIVTGKIRIPQIKALTPEIIAKVETMLATGLNPHAVARKLHMNPSILYSAISRGKVVSGKSHIPKKKHVI